MSADDAAAKAPLGSLLTLAIIEPSGRRRLLGYVLTSRNKLAQTLIGTPLRWHLDFNTARHNRRMERL